MTTNSIPYPGIPRTWGRPPLHTDALISLSKPWSAHTFPARDHVWLYRPLSLPSLPTKANFNPNLVFTIPPSDDGRDVLLFSEGSKSRGKVGAAFVHLHPATGPIIGYHLPLPSYMSIFDARSSTPQGFRTPGSSASASTTKRP